MLYLSEKYYCLIRSVGNTLKKYLRINSPTSSTAVTNTANDPDTNKESSVAPTITKYVKYFLVFLAAFVAHRNRFDGSNSKLYKQGRQNQFSGGYYRDVS